MKPKYLTAIFFKENGQPFKFHNIKNSIEKRTKFENFARSMGGKWVNYYCKDTKQFIPPQITLF